MIKQFYPRNPEALISLTAPFLLYGSYGYTGSLVADLALQQGLHPILAGRNPARLKAQAERLGLEYHCVSLDDPQALASDAQKVPLVLNCAGPFYRTYQPVVEACLVTGRHYIDITGEIAVFEALARLDGRAKEAGVMLLPGVGMDVVPSDCLAAHLKQRLPQATHLTLALGAAGGGFSRGTALTAVEHLPDHGAVRRDGKIVPVPLLGRMRQVDFGHGPRSAVNIPWGDVSTAYYSTGIPNIETYMTLPKNMLPWVRLFRTLIPLFTRPGLQGMLRWLVRWMPPGPSSESRRQARTRFWGEACDEKGKCAISRLETGDGYSLTAETALAVVARVLADDFKPGFQTPSLAYGADFIMGFEGTIREDL